MRGASPANCRLFAALTWVAFVLCCAVGKALYGSNPAKLFDASLFSLA